MPRVRDINYLAQKWVRNAQNAQVTYEEGVRNPLNDWQQNTMAAAQTWRQAIQQAVAEGRWEAGVRATSTQEWQRAAAEKGAQRFGPGVQFARDKWQQRWEPYRNVIEGVQLPPRGPKGDPNNLRRVEVIARALHEAKRRRMGARG